LIGADSNVYNLIGIVVRSLAEAECDEERKEECPLRFQCLTERQRRCLLIKDFQSKIPACQSYGDVLNLMQEYVEVE